LRIRVVIEILVLEDIEDIEDIKNIEKDIEELAVVVIERKDTLFNIVL
jgi:hypothetical protein